MSHVSRIAAINDLSGFGRCSLAVIMPILSIMKHQVCPIPTTILSSHTGGLGEPVIHDLPNHVSAALHHYQQLNLSFDCVYSGYLGEAHHVDDCIQFMQAYPLALKIVDPVMGDHGKPYRHFTPERIRRMQDLVQEADLVTPNMTEVYLLLDEPYRCEACSLDQYKSLLKRLAEKGPKQVVITGAPVNGRGICNLGYDICSEQYYAVPCYYSDVSYPGTGDIFASLLIGNLLHDLPLPESIERATRFLEYVIKESLKYNENTKFGVVLEPQLDTLVAMDLQYEYFYF